MTLKTQLTSDLSVFFNSDEFAESVTYTASGGEATTITAVVVRSMSHYEPYVRGENTAMAEIICKKSQVSAAGYGDTFAFDSQTWELDPVRGVIYEDDDVVHVALERRMS